MKAIVSKTTQHIENSVTEFEVSYGGTLQMANFTEANTREGYYQDVADQWEGSPEDLYDAMDQCQPLAWAVHSIYSEFREEIANDLKSAQRRSTPNRHRVATFRKRLKTLAEEPEEGAGDWLLGLTTQEFETRVLPVIQEWFDAAPDWNVEDEYLPASGTAQGAALLFFENMDENLLSGLGVEIVYGDRPGSTYYAAELTGDIGKANQAAKERGVPVSFKAAAPD